jgi:hypothetical protein
MNVGTLDRLARALAAALSVAAAFALPLSLPWAIGLGGMGVYLLGTALVGSCLGYRLMGRSTCGVVGPGHGP